MATQNHGEGKTGPGKSFREGMSLVELIQRFPDDDAARAWMESLIWPDGPVGKTAVAGLRERETE